ncbi:hypothetical protein RF640_14760 [Kocuria sp. CPCC 205231]|uniref:hypothetical protein n=1 Tax=Kocuria sp. CPCC 205231 TaxID=3073551 RepID=UPI0034D573C6
MSIAGIFPDHDALIQLVGTDVGARDEMLGAQLVKGRGAAGEWLPMSDACDWMNLIELMTRKGFQ